MPSAAAQTKVKKPAKKALASRTSILDAAERVFASFGYEGATMSLIAREAGQAQALLHYYFETKENLYEEIFQRRATTINAFRKQEIERLFAERTKPSLEHVLDIFFLPAPATPTGGGSSPAYSQIVAAVVVADDRRSKDIVARHYDPIAQDFITAFRKVMPTLSHSDAVWAYLFAHGARIQLLSRSGRYQRLSGDKSSRKAEAAAVERLKSFVAAGIKALAG